jgi:hypothetical protein
MRFPAILLILCAAVVAAACDGGGQAPPSPSERIGFVFLSDSPRTDYLNALTAAAKGGWLPSTAAELLLADEQEHAQKQRDKKFPLQLKLRMKRSQVPALKEALAAASLPQPSDLKIAQAQAQSGEQVLPAVESREMSVQEASSQAPSAGPALLAGARGRSFEAGRPSIAPISAVAVKGAEPAQPSEAAATSAGEGGTVAAKTQQVRLENAPDSAVAAMPQQARKTERAGDAIVEVTLRFEFLQAPAAAPAQAGTPATRAGAASSAASQ